ncbi:MAG: M48 family metalloprotease, partial [Proteobacteria bacterium]|nr:M48 family metalloprotease [Pseudomonadota bacterium]
RCNPSEIIMPTSRLWLLTALLAACGTKPTSSKLQHDLGRPINNPSAFQWVDVPDDLYPALVGVRDDRPKAPLNRGNLLAADHPVTQRMQFWLDQVDASLRQAHGSDLAQVPRPRAKVFLSNGVNAFVSTVPVCLELKAIILRAEGSAGGDESSGPSTDDEAWAFSRHSGEFAVMKVGEHGAASGGFNCVKSGLSLTQQVDDLRWNLRDLPDCKVTVDGDLATLSAGCPRMPGRAPLSTRPRRLVMSAVSNQVTIFSATLELMSEHEMAAVLAHELGHYYMAHGVTPAAQYGIFYHIDAVNPDHKPVSDPVSAELGKRLMAAIHRMVYFTVFQPMPQQRLHSSLYLPLRAMAPLLSTITASVGTDHCQLLNHFFAQEPAAQLLTGFPYRPMTQQAEREAYERFESLALSCASSIQLSPDDDRVVTALTRELGREDHRLIQAIQPMPSATSLTRLLLTLSELAIPQAAAKQATMMNALYSEAIQQNLGWFTAEQEADELSAEWLDSLGINPTALVESLLKIIKATETTGTEPATGTIRAAACEALYRHGWHHDDGSAAMVPVALWNDIHHSGCFRAFNADREIRAHHLDKHQSTQAPSSGSKGWEELVTELKRLRQP